MAGGTTSILSTAARAAAAPASGAGDVLLAEWRGPYGGVPAFDKVKPDMFPAAFQAGMDMRRTEIAAIANNTAPATFDNVFVPLEDEGRPLNRAGAVWGVFVSTMNSDEVQKIDTEWSPKFAAFRDEIVQNPKLFARIEAVYNSPDKARLTPEQQRLVWDYYTDFVRAGAKLTVAQKKTLADYNQQLATLFTKFSQNQLADEEDQRVVLESQADLAGLPQNYIDALAEHAKEKGMPGKWAIQNTRSAMEPFLTYSTRRDLREKAFRLWNARGSMGGAHDNNKICAQILMLRAKRAKLLGYPTFAHWRLEKAVAQNPDNAMKLMMQVWPAAVARVKEEVADMQKVADAEGAGIKIEAWDYRHYAEKVRKAKYDLDDAEIKPYLQMEKIREGIFWASKQLFDFNWTEVSGVPVVRPEIRVWKVSRSNGDLIGLWYFDPYAREGKSSGAWMNEYRTQERIKGDIKPIVSNNCNFTKGKPGEPELISWDDANTMFHEFGHAIHGLNSDVTYPSLAGTNVPADFVEFPSQINEHYLETPEVLSKFALHYQTGKPMPQSLVDKIKKARTFNQGFAVTEYLSNAIFDMKLHLAGEREIDIKAFEKETFAELGMPKEMVMRHPAAAFGHIFSDDGYAAGYYSYLWSEVFEQDAFRAFIEEGGPYNKKTAERYRKLIVSRGNTVDVAEAYRQFRGRDPSIVPYLEDKGFPTAGAS